MIPNLITASRIVFAPFFAYAFIAGVRESSPGRLWVALVMLALIELSDALDGHVARALGQVSDFGKLFDPIADALSRQVVFLGMLAAGVMPLWMFLIFVYRDSLVSALRFLCMQKGIVVAARSSGKIKAILQGIGSFAVVLYCLAPHYGTDMPLTIAGLPGALAIMLIPALYTLYSLFEYWAGNATVVFGKK